MAGGVAAALSSWGDARKDNAFATRIKASLLAKTMLMDPSGGYGTFSDYVWADTSPIVGAANLMEKGDYFVALNLPHEIVNGEVTAGPLAETNQIPGPFFGTIKVEYMLEHLPADVFEIMACAPIPDSDGACNVIARLAKTMPAELPIPNYTPAATTDEVAKIGTTISFVWDGAINIVIRATDQLITSTGGIPKALKSKRSSEAVASGKPAGVFNGEMKDGDGMPLLCLDKANYVKEEKRSRPLRRLIGPERALAFLGEMGYVIDVSRIRGELRGAFSDHLRTNLPTWAIGVTDFATKVYSLPAWEDAKVFEVLIRCGGTTSDPTSLSLRHFLPSEIKYDVNSLVVLDVALARLDCMLAYTFDPSFYRQSDGLRDRILGGDLCCVIPKYLWYAGNRAFVQWQRILRGEMLNMNDQFKMANREPGQAARIWKDCLDTNFELTFIKTVRDEWDVIQSRSALDSVRPEKPAAAEAIEPPLKRLKGGKDDRDSDAAMCTNFARKELKFSGPNTPGCKNDDCKYRHYKLGGMKLEAAKDLIQKHANPKQVAGLTAAAEKLLRA